jgi:hypothetical protein
MSVAKTAALLVAGSLLLVALEVAWRLYLSDLIAFN